MGCICNLKNVVYQRKNLNDEKIYIGISSFMWRLRYNNHIHSFSLTALSKHFWKFKNRGLTPKSQWKIFKKFYNS